MFFARERLRLYLGGLLALQLCTCLPAVQAIRTCYIDLRTFYTAGAMLRLGHAPSLYNYAAEQAYQSALVNPAGRALPMMTPPPTAMLFVPLSHLSFWNAYFVFACLNLVLLLASVWLLKPTLTELSSRWKIAPELMFLSFFPVGLALMMGQLSILLLALYSACFALLRRGDHLLAGLVLSAALIKFQIALPVALLFILWRQWTFVAGFLGGAACFTALSVRIIGTGAFLPYLHSLYSMTRAVTADPYAQLHFAILPREMPNIYGTIFTLTGGAAWSHVLILALSIVLFAWAAMQRPSLPLALLAALLVSYHLFFYDLTLLLLPLSLLADQFLRAPSPHSANLPAYRFFLSRISLGILLLTPFVRIFLVKDWTCWFALPILGLLLFSSEWPALEAPELQASMAGYRSAVSS